MTAPAMSFREMNLRVFQGQPIPHVLFQPRFEPWHHWHEIFHAFPSAYAGMSVRDLYDHLGVSDEVPEGLGEEAILRLELVAEAARNYPLG